MIFKKITAILFLFLALYSCTKSTTSHYTELTKSIDSLLSAKTTKPFNGIVLIAKDGKIEYSKIIGYSDLEKKTPLDIDNQFVIGSVSKQFTAAIVLREYDKGNLDLHVPIKKYQPNLSEKWADSVTVHHLLAHTHGIVSLDKPALFPVGTQYNYSQIGYDLLAKIAETTSGKTFADLSAEVFKECGMHNTFHPEKKEYKNLVKGYVENEKSELEYADESLMQYPAAGAFISTANDLVLWNQKFFEGKLLKENTMHLLTTKQENAIRNHPVFGPTDYGYGITVDNTDKLIQWGQTGLNEGFTSMNFYFPQSKTSIIVLENVNYDVSDLKKVFYYHAQILNLVKKELSKSVKSKNKPL